MPAGAPIATSPGGRRAGGVEDEDGKSGQHGDTAPETAGHWRNPSRTRTRNWRDFLPAGVRCETVSGLLAVLGDGLLVELDAQAREVRDRDEPVRVDAGRLGEHRVASLGGPAGRVDRVLAPHVAG